MLEISFQFKVHATSSLFASMCVVLRRHVQLVQLGPPHVFAFYACEVTVLRLAVKYQLHPLPVEDTIQLLDM
jgi:hypothetical protein